MTLDELAAIEAIKCLKARYCRFLDTRDWDNYGNLFIEDGTVAMDRGLFDQKDPSPPYVMRGRSEIVSKTRAGLADGEIVHHVSMPEIELTSRETATGIWALHDIFNSRDYQFYGCGYYHENYVLSDGDWRIASLHLKWVYTRNTHLGSTGRPGHI